MRITTLTTLLLAVGGTLVLTPGCSKQEPAAPETTTGAPAAAPAAADAADAQSRLAAEAKAKADADAAAQAAQAAVAQKQADAAKAADALKQQAEANKAAAEKAAADQLAASKSAADKLAQAATTAAQEKDRILSLIESAKNLTGQNKYAEALNILGQLSNLKLTPEQQAVVDGLKKQAQNQAQQALTDKAAAEAQKALGNAFGGKK